LINYLVCLLWQILILDKNKMQKEEKLAEQANPLPRPLSLKSGSATGLHGFKSCHYHNLYTFLTKRLFALSLRYQIFWVESGFCGYIIAHNKCGYVSHWEWPFTSLAMCEKSTIRLSAVRWCWKEGCAIIANHSTVVKYIVGL